MYHRPDFSIMLYALGRAKEPGRVPFFELFADREIIEEVMGFKLADPGSESGKYFDQLASFYYELGYDYVPFYLIPRFPLADKIDSEDT
ncbi:MAG: uroporphyrinogen-III decarboxylase-like protein, partial [Thermotogaceae bacterium]|nr:uroporphyrinogen-III decarboxylase-like protein [Thermotogaceae bacterium]